MRGERPRAWTISYSTPILWAIGQLLRSLKCQVEGGVNSLSRWHKKLRSAQPDGPGVAGLCASLIRTICVGRFMKNTWERWRWLCIPFLARDDNTNGGLNHVVRGHDLHAKFVEGILDGGV